MTMRIGASLPVRELRDDLGAIREFAARPQPRSTGSWWTRAIGMAEPRQRP